MFELKEIKPIKIIEDIYALGLGLWLSRYKTLVISDLHLGYEEQLNAQGILIPRTQFKETKHLLEKILEKVKPETIVINGDLKHEFGVISRQEWHETLAIFDFLSSHCKKVILVKGNHDTILEPLANKRKLDVVNFYSLGDIFITHGHKIPVDEKFKKGKLVIIGNEHPAISLREGVKSEIYKCFLVGKWRGKKLVVLPSFLPIIEGTDIRREQVLSPFLKQSLKNFEIFVVGDKVYRFGKLKDLR